LMNLPSLLGAFRLQVELHMKRVQMQPNFTIPFLEQSNRRHSVEPEYSQPSWIPLKLHPSVTQCNQVWVHSLRREDRLAVSKLHLLQSPQSKRTLIQLTLMMMWAIMDLKVWLLSWES
jgi:hypothetical protein